MHLDCRGEGSRNRNASRDESVETGDESVEARDESIEAGEKTQQSCYNQAQYPPPAAKIYLILNYQNTMLPSYFYNEKPYICNIVLIWYIETLHGGDTFGRPPPHPTPILNLAQNEERSCWYKYTSLIIIADDNMRFRFRRMLLWHVNESKCK